MLNKNTDFTSIAHQSIQDRRATTTVPCGPQGVVHDYIPFYFAPRSPMLYSISKGNVAGYDGDQRSVIYLVSTADAVANQGTGFVFTDGHAIMAMSRFFDNLDDLDKVDWQLMHSRYWFDTQQDNDRKRRRQAEFLVYHFFPWELISRIIVMDKRTESALVKELTSAGVSTSVQCYRPWYY